MPNMRMCQQTTEPFKRQRTQGGRGQGVSPTPARHDWTRRAASLRPCRPQPRPTRGRQRDGPFPVQLCELRRGGGPRRTVQGRMIGRAIHASQKRPCRAAYELHPPRPRHRPYQRRHGRSMQQGWGSENWRKLRSTTRGTMTASNMRGQPHVNGVSDGRTPVLPSPLQPGRSRWHGP